MTTKTDWLANIIKGDCMKKLYIFLWARWYTAGWRIKYWVAKHAPKIARRKPSPPVRDVCPDCHHTLTKIIAVDTGDGWLLAWECQNNCGATEGYIEDWWPFWFGAYCNSKDLERVGIEVV